ncbi:MAG: YciI family protein [Nocardioidaceae bacterium]
MSQYLVLIYEDEAAWAAASDEEAAEFSGAHREFGQHYQDVLRGGNALQPTSTATSVRVDRSGGVAVTDGAFAETKEALGGYYLVEAVDLDEALVVARQVPTRYGGVEVRPIMPVG